MLVILSLLVFSVHFCHGFGNDIIFELPDKERTCFSEVYTSLTKVIFEYRVLEGGNKDVDVKILSPNGKVLYKETKMNGDKITMDTSDGEFAFCFSNEFSTITHKKIFFSLRPYETGRLVDEAGGQQVPTVLTASEVFCEGIHKSMTAVTDFQRIYRIREAIGRYVAENLSTRVMCWSAVQAGIILVAGLGQVLILKFFFTEKRPPFKPPTDDNIQPVLHTPIQPPPPRM